MEERVAFSLAFHGVEHALHALAHATRVHWCTGGNGRQLLLQLLKPLHRYITDATAASDGESRAVAAEEGTIARRGIHRDAHVPR